MRGLLEQLLLRETLPPHYELSMGAELLHD
jgi:hypothetical protein